ncbi:MAG: DJ-1/PfpI family protein [Kiritimatiellaeota bacterium]|nr:DJ-1/PfpI family protein [Kiritimatiellota bacterium]
MRTLIPLAHGVEEMEAVITIDMLRRCGIEAVTASIAGTRAVRGSRGIEITADALLSELDPATFDALAIPGGKPGVDALRADGRAAQLAKDFFTRGKLVAAICAAPLILHDAGLLEGRAFTCHPAVASTLPSASTARVCADGNLVTACGAGATFAFALAIAARLAGGETARRAAQAACVLPEPC